MATHLKAPATEKGKVANSAAQGVLDGFAGLMTDEQDGHFAAEHKSRVTIGSHTGRGYWLGSGGLSQSMSIPRQLSLGEEKGKSPAKAPSGVSKVVRGGEWT